MKTIAISETLKTELVYELGEETADKAIKVLMKVGIPLVIEAEPGDGIEIRIPHLQLGNLIGELKIDADHLAPNQRLTYSDLVVTVDGKPIMNLSKLSLGDPLVDYSSNEPLKVNMTLWPIVPKEVS